MRGKGINYDTGFFPGGSGLPAGLRSGDRAPRAADHRRGPALHRRPDLRGAAGPARGRGRRLRRTPGWRSGSRRSPARRRGRNCWCCWRTARERAERIRAAGAEVVFVAGCETSLFCPATSTATTPTRASQTLGGGGLALWSRLGEIMSLFNGYLAEAAATVREHFRGTVTLRVRAVGVPRLDAVRLRVRGRLPLGGEQGQVRRGDPRALQARQAGGGHRVRLHALYRLGRSRRHGLGDPRRLGRPAGHRRRLRPQRGRADNVLHRTPRHLRGSRPRLGVLVHLRHLPGPARPATTRATTWTWPRTAW